MLSNMGYGYDTSLLASPMPILNISGNNIINGSCGGSSINNNNNKMKKGKISTSPVQSPLFKNKSNVSTVPQIVQKLKSPNSLNSPNVMNNYPNLISLNPNSTASIINNQFSNILQVIEQESISTENVILNNRNASAHIVVKNTCFVIKIKSMDTSILNFSNCLVKATLFYANEPLKEVSYIQTPPINYFGSAINQGEYFSLDIKISILSSQHQGNLFYIMFYINDPHQPQNPPFQVLSHPIRVVSKVDHIKKDGSGILEKKQTFIDVLTDRLNVLESIHVSQSGILSHMLKQRGLYTDHIIPSGECFEDDLQLFQEKPKVNSKITAEKFLESFNKVIRVYKKHKEDSNLPDQNQIITLTNDKINNDNNDDNNNNNSDNLNYMEDTLIVDQILATPPINTPSLISTIKSPILSNTIPTSPLPNNSNNNNNNNNTSGSCSPLSTTSSSPLELSRFIENLNESEKSILMDLLDSFTFNENVKPQNPEDEECNCENCPHKKMYLESQHLDPNFLVQSPQFSFQ